MIRANDAKDMILAKHEEAIKRTEKAIDSAILACEEPGGTVRVVVCEALHPVVCERIREMYDVGGWGMAFDVHHAQEQRDDTYTTFVLGPKINRARVVPMTVDRDEPYRCGSQLDMERRS